MPDVTELRSAVLSPRELTIYNAVRKGLSVLSRRTNGVVLACDTDVALEDEVLGKPADMRQARQFLRRLSGRTHQVYSAIFVGDHRRVRIASEVSHVTFRTLGEREIGAYLRRINPLDKAGGYAAQGAGADVIERIDGSYSNVIGLPMERTLELLREFGVVIASQRVRLPEFAPRAGGRAARRGRGTRR